MLGIENKYFEWHKHAIAFISDSKCDSIALTDKKKHREDNMVSVCYRLRHKRKQFFFLLSLENVNKHWKWEMKVFVAS